MLNKDNRSFARSGGTHWFPRIHFVVLNNKIENSQQLP